MNTVKVKTAVLLEKIKANRDAHRDLFLKAQIGYRKDIIEELDRMLQEARDNKPIRRHISLPEPQDHTDEYDRTIMMLEMSVDETIEISAQQFDCFVRDNWSWKAFTDATNTMYATKAV